MVRGKGGGGLIDMYQNASPYPTEAILSMIPVYLILGFQNGGGIVWLTHLGFSLEFLLPCY